MQAQTGKVRREAGNRSGDTFEQICRGWYEGQLSDAGAECQKFKYAASRTLAGFELETP
jgi:hypothetical protein